MLGFQFLCALSSACIVRHGEGFSSLKEVSKTKNKANANSAGAVQANLVDSRKAHGFSLEELGHLGCYLERI